LPTVRSASRDSKRSARPPILRVAFPLFAPELFFGLATGCGSGDVLVIARTEFPTPFGEARFAPCAGSAAAERHPANHAYQQDRANKHRWRLNAGRAKRKEAAGDDEHAQHDRPNGRDRDRSEVLAQAAHAQRVQTIVPTVRIWAVFVSRRAPRRAAPRSRPGRSPAPTARTPAPVPASFRPRAPARQRAAARAV
jgi:hypothetical protein